MWRELVWILRSEWFGWRFLICTWIFRHFCCPQGYHVEIPVPGRTFRYCWFCSWNEIGP